MSAVDWSRQLQWWPSLGTSQARGSVLIVDGDRHVCEELAVALSSRGLTVHTAASPSGLVAFALASKLHPEVVVMEVDLEGMDGVEVLRRLHDEHFDGAVVFLSVRGSVTDKIDGLTMGAADYITKPYDVAEVVARIGTILRRALRSNSNSNRTYATQRRAVADLELDPAAHQVRKAGVVVALSPTEFRLLHHFMDYPDKVLSHADIIETVWHADDSIDANVVRTYVKYLRRKLDPDARLLRTVRGVGYVLRPPPR